MKRINIKSYLVILAILLGSLVVISSCIKDKDYEDPIIPKTLEEYITEMRSFISSETLLLDTCEIGYNKYDFKVASTANFTPYKTAYKLVLDTANARINRSGITIADMIALNKTFSIPGKTFWGALFLSDRRPLNDSIVSSEALNTAIIVGTGPGQVLQDSKTTFTAAITTARSTRDATVTIGRQIPPAISKLEDAENIFRAAIIPAAIEEYQAKAKTFVAAEKTIVETCSVGYDKDEYNVTQKIAYLTVLLAAEPIVNDPAATYVTISGALNTLPTPGKAFYASKFICDRRPLNDSIVVCQTLNTNTLVGTAAGQVPAAAKTTFTNAITTAVTARDKATTTEGQVKAAIYALSNAKSTFIAAIIK